jgi:hypothetical protein
LGGKSAGRATLWVGKRWNKQRPRRNTGILRYAQDDDFLKDNDLLKDDDFLKDDLPKHDDFHKHDDLQRNGDFLT